MAEIPRNEIRLVLIGKTGNGKSSSCNTIIGKEVFPFGCDNNGVTTTSSVRYAKRFGKLICLVDTQGQNNEYYQKEIKKCINFTTPGPHAIILVVHLNRFTVEDVETVNHFCAHFGGNVEQYVIVLFTRFDDMKREMEKKSNHTGMRGFIENLKPPLKEFLSKCGNRYIEFDNTLGGTSADSQVQRLLDIVDNMVRDNGGLHYTNEDYEIAEKELQRQAMETKKKNDQDGMKIEEKMINSLSDIRKQYEQKQQELIEKELQRCRGPPKGRNIVDVVCSHGKKTFGW